MVALMNTCSFFHSGSCQRLLLQSEWRYGINLRYSCSRRGGTEVSTDYNHSRGRGTERP